MLAGTTNLRRLDQVEHFWDTVDTIGEGFGFSLFGARHLVTLALYIGFAALSCKLYKAADEKKRAQLRGLFAVLLLADEAFKQIGLQIGGNFNWDYLPLHLCSINIFLIALYAWKPSRLLDNFLYFICIPAATAALLFPTWTSLPAANFMFWHSTSVHILLAAYPIMLFSGGDIRPSVRYMGKCFLLLLAMAVPIYCVNLLLDTNFMFLMYAPDGNPLAWFRDHVGYHWIGFPVLLVAALLFPTWTSLPAANFMFWHSTSVHILLAAYPIMLFSGGDIRPSVRYMGKCFLLLLAMAVPIYCVNLLLDTNFMFLMYAPDGNPLAWFRDHVGYHWIGFPVLLVAVFALMDVPIMLKKRKEDKLLSAVK